MKTVLAYFLVGAVLANAFEPAVNIGDVKYRNTVRAGVTVAWPVVLLGLAHRGYKDIQQRAEGDQDDRL